MSVSTDTFESEVSVLLGVLDELLAEIKQIKAAMTGAQQQVGKVEIKTSTRGADITVTAYTSTAPADLDDTRRLAIAQYREAVADMAAETMASFVAEANRRSIQG